MDPISKPLFMGAARGPEEFFVLGLQVLGGDTATTPKLYIYERDGAFFSYLDDQPDIDTKPFTSLGGVFSPDGELFYASTGTTSPAFIYFKREGAEFTKLSDPTQPAGRIGSGILGLGQRISTTSDGVYVAIAHANAPFLTIYKRSGDTLAKLPDVADPPPSGTFNDAEGVAFSPDGIYLAVATPNSPFLALYKRDGDTFTRLPNPSVLPPGQASSTSFSNDGAYLVVTHFPEPSGSAANFFIYKRAGDVFTKLSDPAVLPTGSGANFSVFSRDNTYLAVSFFPPIPIVVPGLFVYKRAGDVFTKLADPVGVLNNAYSHMAFSQDGNLLVACTSFPSHTVFERGGDVFTAQPLLEPFVPSPSVGNFRGTSASFFPRAVENEE